ncbi:MAG: MFS transporter [Candidatus Thorarchaeota archaeon]
MTEGYRIEPTSDGTTKSEFMGLSRNLWRLAIVLAVAQFSIALWKWEFSIFLYTFTEQWMMGVTFSLATFAALVGGFFSGTIADFIGRKRAMMLGFIPVAVGLFLMAYYPIWPIILVQTGFVWYGMSSFRMMGQAIPADEIAQNDKKNPARTFMMVLMPLWFADGLGPLTGAFLLNLGYTSNDLHSIAAVFAILALVIAQLTLKESLGTETVQKAREGPAFSLRQYGPDFWKLLLGMIAYYFFFTTAISYLGNLCVEEWFVDTATYGYTWSAFSFVTAGLIYTASGYADKNLKKALIFAVCGNGLAFLAFGIGTGVVMLYIINILWAIPFIVWIGVERSILVANVPDEAKGRALGTYQVIVSSISMLSQMLGAFIWSFTGSLRFLWTFAGIGMIASTLIIAIVLRSIKTEKQVAAILD